MSALRIGIAIGEDAVTAVAHAGGLRHSAVEPLPARALESAGALATALQAVAATLESALGHALGPARVHIALQPPLADARLVQLPPLRPREAEAVLRRDAARHFVGGAVARVVGVVAVRRDAAGPTLAAAAALPLVETVRSAVAAAGWRLAGVVPAHASWLAALPAAERGETAAGLAVIAVEGAAAHVIRREGDTVTVLRRVPVAWIDEVVAAAGTPGTAVIFAESPDRTSIVRAFRAAGWTVEDADAATAADAAAAHAGDAQLELVPPTLAAARRSRQRAVAWRVAASALLLVAGAAALELWGTRRELTAVRARRAEIRDDVAPLLAARDSLGRLEGRIAAIRTLDTDAPRWTRALFDLALLLPQDTRLTSLQANGDTVVIEAAGARAGAALQALRNANSLRDVRLDGTVERDLQDGETAVERFRVRARLVMPETWAPPPIATHDSTRTGGRSPRVAREQAMRRSM